MTPLVDQWDVAGWVIRGAQWRIAPMNAVAAVVLSLMFAQAPSGQEPTFHDFPCGTSKTVSAMRPITFLRSTVGLADLIVRATLGEGTSQLSADARNIYTTFELMSPRILFVSPRVPSGAIKPGEPLVMAQRGGRFFRDGQPGCVLSEYHSENTPLRVGMEAILLLTARDGLFYEYESVFEVQGASIVLPREPHFKDAGEFTGMTPDQFIEHVLRLKGAR
jgi:hypothetical protein